MKLEECTAAPSAPVLERTSHREGKRLAGCGSAVSPGRSSLRGSLLSDGHIGRSVSPMEVSHLLFSGSNIHFSVRNNVAWNIVRVNNAFDASINGIAGRSMAGREGESKPK